ncbi:hypothetical protein LDVICp203 [lymphocystis disease virus-China]|uniref:Uncharacterized protein n=1 Tax=lymphocystis disease virus-China TaxID=256729 RepID=Q677R1_9VIRU|nr:hypothetical protein LDVICp203 [lymphocystis disease virus-China]AAU11046.1 hypothetical protein [lymphocystis disease virus-China]
MFFKQPALSRRANKTPLLLNLESTHPDLLHETYIYRFFERIKNLTYTTFSNSNFIGIGNSLETLSATSSALFHNAVKSGTSLNWT